MQARKTRVLFFTISLGKGGAEKHVLRLLNYLDRSRFDLSVALAQAGGSYERELAPDVKLHHLPTGRINSTTLQLLRAIRPLRQLIERERPDLVCPVMDLAAVPALLAVRGLKPAPLVVPVVQRVPSLQYPGGELVGRVVYRAMPYLYPRADRVVALSQGVADDVRPLMGRHADKLTVIYNAGVDEHVLSASEEPLGFARPEGPLVVACGRLIPHKGFDYLLRAMARVRDSVPATLWILGEGPERPRLETLARELGIGEHVRFLGFQSNPSRFMAAADVFVLPSLIEAFGNVVVEAMASRTAVVSTDCPHGPGEIIQDGTSGLLVPTADDEALAVALLEVLRSPELRERLAANAYRRAQDFTAQNIADQYGQLFETLAHSN